MFLDTARGGTGGPFFRPFFWAQILATFSLHTASASITCLLPSMLWLDYKL